MPAINVFTIVVLAIAAYYFMRWGVGCTKDAIICWRDGKPKHTAAILVAGALPLATLLFTVRNMAAY